MIIEELQGIWNKDYLIVEIIAVCLIYGAFAIANLISAKILGGAYRTVSNIEKRILKEKPVHDINVYRNYRKITIFSDTVIMGALVLVYLFVCIPVYFKQGARMVLFLFIITIPLLPIAFIISLKRVRKYNRYLARSVLVEGKISERVKENVIGRNAKIEVWYEFIDAYGEEHKCRQIVDRFLLEIPYHKQMDRWEKLYYPGKKVNILVNAYETNLSYLPMREDYCKEYHKLYTLDLD